MFTQCPECSTVFRVTAETLRTAQGRVRCGICASSFSALDYLSETPVARPADEPSDEDTITVEEMPGTEFIELSSAPDAAPADAPAEAADAAMAVTTAGAAEATGEADDIPDTALEYHGSTSDLEKVFVAASLTTHAPADATRGEPDTAAAQELDRAMDEIAAADFSGIEVREDELHWPEDGEDNPEFTETNPGIVAALLALRPARPAPEEPEPTPATTVTGTVTAEDDVDRTDQYPVLVLEEGDRAFDDGEPPASPAATTPGPERQAAPPPAATPVLDEPPPILLIPEELRRGAVVPPVEAPVSPADLAAAPSPRRWPLAVAAVVLALALLAQVVHHWREEIARSPMAGPWLLRAYGALGRELAMPADLSAFELRQFGAASDPGQSGRLRLRASVVNHAPFAQPYPVLRLSLQDRFGSTIASRDLEPPEYLPGGSRSASGLLGPSQRADAEVVFVDPGREAVGFELDVCARDAAGLRCSADLPARAP